MSEEKKAGTLAEKEQARRCISAGVRNLIAAGVVNRRDDIIRHLSGENFEIIRVTPDSITLCAPDEPEETLTLSGYYFSEQFCLHVPEGTERQAGAVSPHVPATERVRRSKVIADGILLSHTGGLAKWGLVCVLARILTGHDWLPAGLVTEEVRTALAGVSAVAAVCLAVVSVLSLVADRGMVRLREWQEGREGNREGAQ